MGEIKPSPICTLRLECLAPHPQSSLVLNRLYSYQAMERFSFSCIHSNPNNDKFVHVGFVALVSRLAIFPLSS